MLVLKQSFKVQVEAMQWGMALPNSTNVIINGRIKELTHKPFFSGLLEKKRCVNGYFEWTQGGEKIPHLITTKDLPDATPQIISSKLKNETSTL